MSDSDDTLLSYQDADTILAAKTEDELNKLIRKSLCATAGGKRVNVKSLETLFESLKPAVGDDGGIYMELQGKRVEFSIPLIPRSTWAFNNGPLGNTVFPEWMNNDVWPDGITLRKSIYKNNNNSDGTVSWTKTAVIGDNSWETQLFPSNFNTGLKHHEYTISGKPANDEASTYAKTVFTLADKFWSVYAKSEGVAKNPAKHGPTASMWMAVTRPVFVPKSASLDEGRGSELEDIHELSSNVTDQDDVRLNRIPEVTIRDEKDKTYKLVSFHDLHRMSRSMVMNVTFTPRAHKYRNTIHWSFRLVAVDLLAKRMAAPLSSPSKKTLKRFRPKFDDDDDDETPAQKKSKTI